MIKKQYVFFVLISVIYAILCVILLNFDFVHGIRPILAWILVFLWILSAAWFISVSYKLSDGELIIRSGIIIRSEQRIRLSEVISYSHVTFFGIRLFTTIALPRKRFTVYSAEWTA